MDDPLSTHGQCQKSQKHPRSSQIHLQCFNLINDPMDGRVGTQGKKTANYRRHKNVDHVFTISPYISPLHAI